MRWLALAIGLLLVSPAHADMFPNAANADLPEAQDNLGIGRSVKAYGAKCDGSTNDTAAVQAAIDANANGALSLPAGRCVVGGLNITKNLRIAGQGTKQSTLVSPNGSTNAVFTVQVTTNAGWYPAVVKFDDFTITSASRIDPPGLNNVHGIRLKVSGGVQTLVSLNNMTIDEVPGSCLYAESGEASGVAVGATNFNCLLPSQYGIYANSTNDWVFSGGALYGAHFHNLACSGCGYFHFRDVNNFSAEQNGIALFNSNNFFWSGGSIDRNQQHGVSIDNRLAGRAVYIGDVTIGYSGAAAANTYSDLYIAATNANDVHLSNITFFDRTTSASANKPLSNIGIIGGNTGYVYANNIVYLAGNWLTAGVISGLASMYRGTEPVRSWTPTLIGTGGGAAATDIQLGNYTVNNGRVTLSGQVRSTSLAGLSGQLLIGGVPVLPVSTTNDYGICSFGIVGGWTAPAGYTQVTGIMNGTSGTNIVVRRNATNGSANAATVVGEWAAASTLSFSCDYRY